MSNRGASLAVIGGINMDLVARVATLPAPGETVLGWDLRQVPGGKGANQAVAAARAGAITMLIGRVGVDAFGDAMLDSLMASGVQIDHVQRDGSLGTGVALIGVDRCGENSIIVVSGSNGAVSGDAVRHALRQAQELRVVVFNCEAPVDVIIGGIAELGGRDTEVIVNLAPFTPLPAEVLHRIDVLIVNEIEAATLVGENLDHSVLATRALAHGPRAVIVTVGSEGCWLADASGLVHIPAIPVQVVDSTGAGDAFVGAFGAARARGDSLLQASRFGVAAGALATSRAGAQPSLPTRDEIDQHLARA
jgi:ribokinase